MSYPFASGEILTAANLNTALGTWATYTPVLTGAGWSLGSTGAAAVGQYCIVGKTTFLECSLTFGTVGATFGAGPPTISLPTSITSGGFRVQGTIAVRFEDTGTTSYWGSAIASTLTTILLYTQTASGPYVGDTPTSSTVPHTWAATDVITAAGWYRST